MKKLSAKFLCVVLSLVVLLCALPVTVYAEGTNVFYVGSAEELTSVCSEINQNGGEYTINLTGDILNTNTENNEYGQIKITNKDAVVTVIGNGHTLYNPATAVYVENGAKVILGNGESELILQGSNSYINGVTNDNPGIIHVLRGSTCEMNDKVTVKDRKSQNYLGAGATVEGGTFIMKGGTIQNCGIDGGSVCYGGGVAVFAGGIFTMNGGTITECYAKSNHPSDDYSKLYTAMGGGVFVSGSSVFTMNGGTISNCEATNFGGGVAVVTESKKYNGTLTSKATVNNGTISDNTALGGAGVFVSGFLYAKAGAIAMDATIGGASGTGTSGTSGTTESTPPSDPGFYVKGGSITQNTASGTYDDTGDYLFAQGLGGGILVVGVQPTVQIHNAAITSNNADHGAGIASFYSWTKADIEGCTITDNTAKRNGGGVYLSKNSSNGAKTTIKNTTITGNSSGDRGAGVYYDAVSELHISGKDIIQNNTFNGVLNNLNVLSKDKPVCVDGDLTGSQIGLSDPRLWDDGLSDIEAPDDGSAELLTSGYKANNPTVHPNEYFTSDHESWVVERTKAEEKEVDDTSIRYYEYTAQRYPVTSIDNNPAGIINDYVRLDVQKADIGRITTLQGVFNELVDIYGSRGYDNYQYNSEKFKRYYTPDNTTITIQMQTYNVNLTFSRNSKSVTYQASTSYQRYADTGVIYFRLSSASDSADYQFSSNPDETPVTVKYYGSATPNNAYIFEYDDLGKITAKLELIGGKYGRTLKYGKKMAIVGDDNEVRLVRKTTVDYHINNDDIAKAKYDGNDIFTSYVEEATGQEVTVGDTIKAFYKVPEITPTKQNSCPYIFKGWYYDKANNIDSNPVVFGTDKYTAGRDIYAHWIKVEDVEKDAGDLNVLPSGQTKYGGFDLSGVQVRGGIIDTNYDEQKMPGGLRFVTSLNMDVVDQINAITHGNNIEYGYVAATNEDWINYHSHYDRKLLYAGENSNGVDTSSDKATNENYFGFANNINCTSKKFNNSAIGIVKEDHRNYKDYLLYTLVITYENSEKSDYDKNVLARPYIHYTDANGLERVAYSEYRGNSNTIGGCYISYNDMPH